MTDITDRTFRNAGLIAEVKIRHARRAQAEAVREGLAATIARLFRSEAR